MSSVNGISNELEFLNQLTCWVDNEGKQDPKHGEVYDYLQISVESGSEYQTALEGTMSYLGGDLTLLGGDLKLDVESCVHCPDGNRIYKMRVVKFVSEYFLVLNHFCIVRTIRAGRSVNDFGTSFNVILRDDTNEHEDWAILHSMFAFDVPEDINQIAFTINPTDYVRCDVSKRHPIIWTVERELTRCYNKTRKEGGNVRPPKLEFLDGRVVLEVTHKLDYFETPYLTSLVFRLVSSEIEEFNNVEIQGGCTGLSLPTEKFFSAKY